MGYICDNVLPHLDQLASPEEGVNGKLELLKLLAETSEFTGDLENLEQRLQNLYDCLIVSTHSLFLALLKQLFVIPFFFGGNSVVSMQYF